jgi:hypothetical protein
MRSVLAVALCLLLSPSVVAAPAPRSDVVMKEFTKILKKKARAEEFYDTLARLAQIGRVPATEVFAAGTILLKLKADRETACGLILSTMDTTAEARADGDLDAFMQTIRWLAQNLSPGPIPHREIKVDARLGVQCKPRVP